MTETIVGEMHKRREKMADGRRYIIYYTFGDDNGSRGESENSGTIPRATSEIENTEESENV